jgi:anti-sigma factor RsiW
MTASHLHLDRSDERLRAYLLGRLPDEDRQALEEIYFADEEVFDRLVEMQHDLVDAWARGDLPADDRRAVEERLLAGPAGGRRAAVAKAFARLDKDRERQPPASSLSAVAAPQPRWFRMAAAAAIAVVSVSSSVWLAMENARLRRAAVPTPTPVVDRPGPPPSSDAPQVAEIRLSPVVLRSEQAAREVMLPPGARLARLLPSDGTATSFVVGIERAGAGRISTQAGLTRDQSGAVVVWIPVEMLKAGDYEVLLWQSREATETLVATYPVRFR